MPNVEMKLVVINVECRGVNSTEESKNQLDAT